MLKAAGISLIVLACTGMGFSFSGDYRKRLEELKYIRQIMLMLRGEIKYTKSPLPEAFFHIGARVREPFDQFLKNVSEELEQLGGHTFQDIWMERIRTDLKELHLKKNDLEPLIRMGENFGYLDGEMQLGTIDLYLEQLELDIGQAENAAGEKTKVYNCLGVMTGLFLAIIML